MLDPKVGAAKKADPARVAKGDRGGDQDATASRVAHLAADALQQVQHAGDVDVDDDVLSVGELLVKEGVSEAVAGIGQRRVKAVAARPVPLIQRAP